MLNPLLINYEESKMSVCFSVKSYILDWLELSFKVWDWQCGKLYFHTCKSSDYWMPISLFFQLEFKMEFRVRQDKGWGMFLQKSWVLQNFGSVSLVLQSCVFADTCTCTSIYVSHSLNFSVKVFQITDLSFTILATSEHSESEHSALTVKN